jgi:hypothetical protein
MPSFRRKPESRFARPKREASLRWHDGLKEQRGPQKLFHNVNQQQARLSHAYH